MEISIMVLVGFMCTIIGIEIGRIIGMYESNKIIKIWQGISDDWKDMYTKANEERNEYMKKSCDLEVEKYGEMVE